MSRVCHIELNTDAPDEAVEFYSEVFGWTIQKKWAGNDDYWLIHTGRSDEPGINGGIKRKVSDTTGFVPSIAVTEIDAMGEKVRDAGGKLISGKIVLPNTGYLLYCEDPEGNTFCLLQKDSSAK